MTGDAVVPNRRNANPARRQRLEVLIGIFGSLTVLAFVTAVAGIVGGEPSAATSLVLLGVAVGLVLAIRARLRA